MPHTTVAIIGSGFAGLGMGARLAQAGMRDFLILERAADLGGTWRDNTYPGAECDVPSHLYSFSFFQNPRWSQSFSGQAEIQQYLQDCADHFGLRPHLRLGHELVDARWDDTAQLWNIETSQGPLTAQFLISGMGSLAEPALPDVPGIDRFKGAMFHSARWDHDHDLTGERVAVVGTGASAIQFVPQIVDRVGHLDLYQRTAPWIIPRRNRRLSHVEQRLFARFPALQHAQRSAIYWSREAYVLGFRRPDPVMGLPARVARRHLAQQVPDPRLRATLTPDYTIGCKRILISNDYYPALTRPHVDVVPAGLTEIRERAVIAADGVERPADTIIFGTGFQVTEFPAGRRLRGREGRTLHEEWSDGAQAHLGCTVHGYPNLFLVVGPNTGLGHTSMVYMIEAQVQYILEALRWMFRRGLRTFEVTAAAQAAYNDRLQERMRDTVWTTGGCASWYLDDTGRNTTLWPDFTWRFKHQTRRFDPESYRFRVADPLPADVAHLHSV
ncbi:MAG TPA: NAD(P)/FAD-dependent oxidoreductase [Egibacteraceae bacterium]|nr:NAD(P)/FAD-dependent oxidoreductase [Egibacteraceae bacterium]